MNLDSLDPDVRELAFWLQNKIYRDGIEGVHFMENARLWAEKNSSKIAAREISKELKKL